MPSTLDSEGNNKKGASLTFIMTKESIKQLIRKTKTGEGKKEEITSALLDYWSLNKPKQVQLPYKD